jgi:peptidoglycan/LPS O-acetylase OafA/YrhL
MSGFVLTNSFQARPRSVFTHAVRRLLRIGIPSIASIIFAAIVLLLRHKPIWLILLRADLDGQTILLGIRGMSIFNLPRLLPDSLNPPLWSISFELAGSFLVLALVSLRSWSAAAYAAFLAASVPLLGLSMLSLFTLGHLCARHQHRLTAPIFEKIGDALGLSSVAAGLYLATSYAWPTAYIPLRSFGLPPLCPWQEEAGGGLIFIGVLLVPALQGLFVKPLPQYLGRLSFPIYLLHYPIMSAVGRPTFQLASPIGHLGATLAALCCGTIITIGIAAAFERYVEAPVISWTKRLHMAAPTPDAKLDTIFATPAIDRSSV